MDSTTMLTFLGMLCLMITFPTYQKAYTEHQQRLHVDAWLYAQCQDPNFATRMRAYTDSCEHVHTIYSQSSWWIALQHTYASYSSGWFMPMLVAMCAGLPTLLLPLYRARQDLWETQRILRECSPFRPIKASSAQQHASVSFL